jgi:hypothetical protein
LEDEEARNTLYFYIGIFDMLMVVNYGGRGGDRGG